MRVKKFLLKIFILSILFGTLQNSSLASAESKIYEGVGYFAVTEESLDYAKNQAKLDGARNIAEQIFLDVQSQTDVKNSAVQHDEIITKTEGLLKILDVKYKILPDESDENNFVVQAKVTAEVDSDELEKILAE